MIRPLLREQNELWSAAVYAAFFSSVGVWRDILTFRLPFFASKFLGGMSRQTPIFSQALRLHVFSILKQSRPTFE